MEKRTVAITCVVLGVAGIVGALFMDTTVSSGIGRIHNIGLMNDQQNYLIVSGIVAIIGIILFVTLPKKQQALLPPSKGGGSAWIDKLDDTTLPFGIERVGTVYVVNGSQFPTVADAMAYAGSL